MFDKILIANRGEIACRVIHTARQLGIRTVAVYSEADAAARHVKLADEAWLLGPAAPKASYLLGDKLIDIARQTGAQAIHPGYGFLSENEDFAAACEAAGIVFIGPPASSIAAMGSKSAAKQLMERAQVPLVPGYHGDDQDPALLAREAARIGFPVLIKASAGGGGKGMKIVEHADDFASQLASAQREALASFGDDKVLVEKYLTKPRHVEIQVFADQHGQCVYLFERDCSVQRRHQKVLEEAPAPGMSEAQRQQMGDTACNAAKAIGYVGAGTVEFILDTLTGAFYFMEMNTRLQVEHPVTEMITGQDLVEWQLRVACGEPLPLSQSTLRIHGHALEARIYAEDPTKDFLPAIGKLQVLRTPATSAQVRIDSGVVEGDEISPYYDPMIAKLIVWGEDRPAALRRMRQALAEYRIVGLTTNVDFLAATVAHPAFASGDVDTGLIARHRAELIPDALAASPQVLAIAALAELANIAQMAEQRRTHSDDPTSPWNDAAGWRLNEATHVELHFRDTSGDRAVLAHYRNGGFIIEIAEEKIMCELLQATDGQLRVNLAGRQLTADIIHHENELHLFVFGQHHILQRFDPVLDGLDEQDDAGSLRAPMPGTVVAVLVAAGQPVEKGQPLIVLEAMKMEHTIAAPAAGLVAELLYQVGERVNEGTELILLNTET
ncbi:3-methylcrotonyl-CoA carboxylase alpha subunit [Chitinivorax tropicus]|uniref:3-methylcrotonyl-CoA carboxylase alpha subunit n=1 Tax=Chitinivorax tropicus TaxID=714531 RepID=A0A840MQ10_9PROT|nr:acetyl/propionyl/methylcrotonyl-CoA carboxylase subunit alpha [Chitinivorax tropicus]MBB5018556.1 3-methylcrotonyl-CoA carboxylase alpha subunit [Chitinivorax tropicus]